MTNRINPNPNVNSFPVNHSSLSTGPMLRFRFSDFVSSANILTFNTEHLGVSHAIPYKKSQEEQEFLLKIQEGSIPAFHPFKETLQLHFLTVFHPLFLQAWKEREQKHAKEFFVNFFIFADYQRKYSGATPSVEVGVSNKIEDAFLVLSTYPGVNQEQLHLLTKMKDVLIETASQRLDLDVSSWGKETKYDNMLSWQNYFQIFSQLRDVISSCGENVLRDVMKIFQDSRERISNQRECELLWKEIKECNHKLEGIKGKIDSLTLFYHPKMEMILKWFQAHLDTFELEPDLRSQIGALMHDLSDIRTLWNFQDPLKDFATRCSEFYKAGSENLQKEVLRLIGAYGSVKRHYEHFFMQAKRLLIEWERSMTDFIADLSFSKSIVESLLECTAFYYGGKSSHCLDYYSALIPILFLHVNKIKEACVHASLPTDHVDRLLKNLGREDLGGQFLSEIVKPLMELKANLSEKKELHALFLEDSKLYQLLGKLKERSRLPQLSGRVVFWFQKPLGLEDLLSERERGYLSEMFMLFSKEASLFFSQVDLSKIEPLLSSKLTEEEYKQFIRYFRDFVKECKKLFKIEKADYKKILSFIMKSLESCPGVQEGSIFDNLCHVNEKGFFKVFKKKLNKEEAQALDFWMCFFKKCMHMFLQNRSLFISYALMEPYLVAQPEKEKVLSSNNNQEIPVTPIRKNREPEKRVVLLRLKKDPKPKVPLPYVPLAIMDKEEDELSLEQALVLYHGDKKITSPVSKKGKEKVQDCAYTINEEWFVKQHQDLVSNWRKIKQVEEIENESIFDRCTRTEQFQNGLNNLNTYLITLRGEYRNKKTALDRAGSYAIALTSQSDLLFEQALKTTLLYMAIVPEEQKGVHLLNYQGREGEQAPKRYEHDLSILLENFKKVCKERKKPFHGLTQEQTSWLERHKDVIKKEVRYFGERKGVVAETLKEISDLEGLRQDLLYNEGFSSEDDRVVAKRFNIDVDKRAWGNIIEDIDQKLRPRLDLVEKDCATALQLGNSILNHSWQELYQH